MNKSASYAKCGVLGVLLFGLASSTDAASIPPEIVLTQNAVNRILKDAESYVVALAAKCDECDSSTRDNSRKAMVALRQAIGDLERNTNRKVEDIVKACK